MDSKHLNNKRGNIKGQLTRFETHLNKVKEKIKTQIIIDELKCRLARIELLLVEFDKVQTDIEINDENDDTDEHFKERESFEDTFFTLIALAKNIIINFENASIAPQLSDNIIVNDNSNIAPLLRDNNINNENPTIAPQLNENNINDENVNSALQLSSNNVINHNSNISPQSSSNINTIIESSNTTNRSNITNNATNINVSNIKLPTIELPKFEGKYEQWLEYFDSFNSLIHENRTLSNIQKFHYLKSSLSGEASQTIQSLEVSSNNYEIAWKLLRDRFENKRLIIHNHISAIFELPSINRENSFDLRRLFDNISKHLRSLKSLGEPVDSWDTLLIYLIVKKLDARTKREWEEFNIKNTIPNMEDMNNFLKNKCHILEVLNLNKSETKTNVYIKEKRNFNNSHQTNSYLASSLVSCVLCKKNHSIYHCDKFCKLSVDQRLKESKNLGLCINCLRKGHFVGECKSTSSCKKCQKRHNTLLHIDHHNKAQSLNTQVSNTSQDQIECEQNLTLSNCSLRSKAHHQILLATANVLIKDSYNQFQNCRLLLDSGSQSNFITSELCDKLGLKKCHTNSSVIGINQAISNIKFVTNVEIKSRVNEYKRSLSCLVLDRITDAVPLTSFSSSILNIPHNITLADNSFNVSNKIDILLGANVFWELLCIGQIQLGKNQPVLQKTKLGWIISGSLGHTDQLNSYQSYFICNSSVENNIETKIEKFWELEQVSGTDKLKTGDELYCENHFKQTVKRAPDGRFIVNIPFNNKLSSLGNSRTTALKRFYNIERKLNLNLELKQQYNEFMQEYLDLKHMNLTSCENDGFDSYYLPHRAVIKEQSLTTKTRVVFDGSAKTDSGLSINDCQFKGSNLQNDIFSVILRFRKHQIVLTADVAKMYRQILIDQNQCKYQRIFYRFEPFHKLQCYELKTLTYGTTSAPFLAVRCLQELAHLNKHKHPSICDIILNDFYVDDLITGGNDLDEVRNIQIEITKILDQGKFQLRKWSSNNCQILNEIKEGTCNQKNIVLGSSESEKTLGVVWDPASDVLKYSFTAEISGSITKRLVLSNTAKIFDPLGLLGPFVVIAKLIIQQLWQLKTSWDESLPASIFTSWKKFENQLKFLENIKIPRLVVSKAAVFYEIHGFCDASEKAYGACIYLKTVDIQGISQIHLLCAKSRVAPLRKETLPRLELCGAVLLSNLLQKVKISLKMNINQYYLWCDSTIVLCWIKNNAARFKTFVANRISEIQKHTNIDSWHHIRSLDNPADIISRGCELKKLLESRLWWEGPLWLKDSISPIEQNSNSLTDHECQELKSTSTVLPVIVKGFDLFDKFSALSKLQRVFAYCLRFISNSRNKLENRKTKHLSTNELNNSLNCLAKIVQNENFSSEIKQLRSGKQIPSSSKLLNLNPFLDKDGLIRVGGRIKNSDFEYTKKHPIILPAKHKFSLLIFKNEHERLLHCGSQALLYSVREKWWPLNGRNTAKFITHKCIICFKINPKAITHQMGDLPKSRLTPSPPFFNCGIDYAGPFLIKDKRSRGAKLIKAYVCLFICFSTKAIHLELVANLTTDNFIACLRRFIARRGRPQNIFTDNATNFIGAKRELKELFQFQNQNTDVINKELANEGINWHNIPPRSPHFGGLWEAGIKSTKNHLKRILGNANVVFEDFYTILTQIESVLNSRPLYALSSDPSDLNTLTPGHFLIGRSLTSLPDPDVRHIPEGRLSHYQRIQQLMQHFWSRWNKEYVSELQIRTKWKSKFSEILKVGVLVLIREENLAPFQWKVGRVEELYPGKDGVPRVALIKLSDSKVKREVRKLCVLPIE